MAQSKPRYNVKEAANLLGLCDEQVRRMCRAGLIGCREGGAWVIYRWQIAQRLGATPQDVEQIRRFDMASRIGREGIGAPAESPPMPGITRDLRDLDRERAEWLARFEKAMGPTPAWHPHTEKPPTAGRYVVATGFRGGSWEVAMYLPNSGWTEMSGVPLFGLHSWLSPALQPAEFGTYG